MSESKTQELGKHGGKKAKTGILEDGPSSFGSSLSSWEEKGGMADGWIYCGPEKCGGGGQEGKMAAEGDGGGLQDPLVVFGLEIMTMILHKLDARSVALSLLVSRGWREVASSDEIWAPKRDELWSGKVHIPRIAKVQGISKLASYMLSVMDGKRARITRTDLCDHVWEFHFTETAPEYWRNLDPYWGNEGTPMRRYFHPDGTITADPGDTVWGGHESCYTIVTGLLADGKIRQHYVRINRWPQMCVERKEDWGWKLYNHLYCYTSIPDSDKEDGTGPFSPLF